ncbi:MAG: sulfatase-like hydrolase/transferase [Planctomycetaceae bacterium]|jgi:arylsulfatase A-like enzyme|nr:sulfatase-like hydrolase/transferase [Planctomycetaceae bacterium]
MTNLIYNRFFFTFLFLFIITGSVWGRQPNIVLILTDDQGYADISLNPQHPKEVSTPNIDSLAKSGVTFRQGYISGCVCSPTRAGLMLGRYQQRVGVYTAGEGGTGFDPKIPIFPDFLPQEYIKTALGKWHLGLDTDFPELKWSPIHRGFDESYGFMGRGGHDYFKLTYSQTERDTVSNKGKDNENKFVHPLYRGIERINDEGYLTDRLSDEAVNFIDRNKKRPFFLYLAYNAVHAPAQAPKETITRIKQKYPELTEERTVLTAMLEHLDKGIGRVIQKLKDENLFDDTLLFFLTDNGGAKGMFANNAPLRGHKASLYEGGIRTPFIVSYPRKFQAGRVIDTPIISLDILPTVVDVLDTTPSVKPNFDGRSLLPLLEGKKIDKHHETLYWSTGSEGSWAIRNGDWKLLFQNGNTELFDLKKDTAEKNNLAQEQPKKVAQLTKLYENWIDSMSEPLGGGSKYVQNKNQKEISEEETKQELTLREKKQIERRNQRKIDRLQK